MWRDLFKKGTIRAALWCALYVIVTVLLQNTLFARVRLWGMHPMFVPAAVIAAAIPQFGTDKSIKWANSDARRFTTAIGIVIKTLLRTNHCVRPFYFKTACKIE